jgi:GDSL-like lipase/acylhydrolase family protein
LRRTEKRFDLRPVGLLSSLATSFLFAALLACGGGSSSPTPTPTPTPPSFANTIFIGDSLAAGFQNGSLLDTQQPHGWAALFAQQAKTPITLPLIASPGAPAVMELVSVGPPPVVTTAPGTTSGRDNPTQQPTDLAVPGHHLHDLINAGPTAVPTSNEDIITTLVLGFPVGNTNTQLQEAIALKPTALLVWIGSNDALVADETGIPSSMTSIASFTADFTQLMSTLHSQSSATLIVANLPDVTAIPYLTPAATVLSEASAQSGVPAAQLALELGLATGDLVTAKGLSEVQAALKNIASGQTPMPLDDAGVLTAAEVQQVQALEDQYNQVIAQQTAAVGGTLVDIHGFFQKLAAGITINNVNATTGYLGGLFSLDGIHPTNTGYALVANQFIDTINTSLKTTLADVDVSTIATTDPLFGPNIKPGASGTHISAEAGQQAGFLLRSRRR